MENCPEFCPQREVAAVTFCKQGSRPIGKISKLLKIKCLEIGVLNSSVDFQECWQCLNSSFQVGSTAQIALLCAQTPAQDACLDENMCVVFLTCPGRKERGCAVVSISKGQDCAGHFRLHHPQLWDAAWDLHCRAECGIHTAPGWAKDCQALLKNHGSFFPAFCINT